MPKRTDIHRILVIGSGPIVIGQAAEFDYSGTQACKALKEEGYEVVLVNSNPATIMTDVQMADRVYIEPLTAEVVEAIIDKEKPDGLLPTLGGQTGLNLGVELSQNGALERHGVEMLGTRLHSIRMAEDRSLFKDLMVRIGEEVAPSVIAQDLETALSFSEGNGYPLIIRPAFTLGGTGGGTAHNEEELTELVMRGLTLSPIGQVLLEQSVAGWKEIEYEVMRDSADNVVAICNMENVDPVGIHTGDSIVVAPCQTLTEDECAMLRAASMRIIRALGIEGGCNIQFALHPTSRRYIVIEVNPRLSRSSALASKATGYPIARVATKIAVGMHLSEIPNDVTGSTMACAEPALDYVVVKVPRWPFDKFVTANRLLGTQMKATGEVMAIGRTYEEALLKAIDSLDIKLNYHMGMAKMKAWTDEDIRAALLAPDHERIFVLSEALDRGMTVAEICELTRIDAFFVTKVRDIVALAAEIRLTGLSGLSEGPLLLRAKQVGFSDNYIAALAGGRRSQVEALCAKRGYRPVYKKVDTCAGAVRAVTPYYYSTYEQQDEAAPTGERKVVVLGSGPIRIGQGIEFDYCSVHASLMLKKMGVTSIIINSNPETVSTDPDTSDRLYFEPLTLECVMDVIAREQPEGVIVQFGGQTAINLAGPLAQEGVRILGTDVRGIDLAEDRDQFMQLAGRLGIPLPPGGAAVGAAQALAVAERVGYPVLVRPSYVIGGRAMEIVYTPEDLERYMEAAVAASNDHPVLVDKYILGREVEVDGICDGHSVLLPGIMEHVERAGVHSGDSIALYPPQTLPQVVIARICETAEVIARAMAIRGLFNIQYVLDENGELFVLEVNPRASRTVPILSKVTGVPMVDAATRICLGETLADMGYPAGLLPAAPHITAKAPVFSFGKMTTVDPFLGPEMKSTGEVMGTADTVEGALYKALLSSGFRLPRAGTVLLSLADRDKPEGIMIAQKLQRAGFNVAATQHTHDYLAAHGVQSALLPQHRAEPLLKKGGIAMVINTPTRGRFPDRAGFRLRRTAMEFAVPCVTSLDTAGAVLRALPLVGSRPPVRPLSAKPE